MSIWIQVFCVDVRFPSFGHVPGNGIVGSWVTLRLNSGAIGRLFTQVAAPVCILSKACQGSRLSTALPTLIIICRFENSHSSGWESAPHCRLVPRYITDKETETQRGEAACLRTLRLPEVTPKFKPALSHFQIDHFFLLHQAALRRDDFVWARPVPESTWFLGVRIAHRKGHSGHELVIVSSPNQATGQCSLNANLGPAQEV